MSDSTHEAAERVAAFLDKWQVQRPALAIDEDIVWTLGSTGDTASLTVADLRAVLAENARMREELAKLDDAEFQWRIVAHDGRTLAPSAFDLANRDQWLPGVRLERRTVYGTPWVDADLHDGGNANA